MANWIPNVAPLELEELMEEKDIPETDRDEVRKFSEFLKRRKDRRDGKELPPAPNGMVDWLLGKDKK